MKKIPWGWVVCLTCALAYGCESDSVGSTHNPIRDICGNALVETGELCDDGNTSGGDGCSADCTVIEQGYECPMRGGACKLVETPPGPEDEKCGNGVMDEGEQCDDGNNLSGDGCSSECQTESGYECEVAGQPCEEKPISDVPCGNGQLDDGEDCDDGNTLDGDGCSSICTVEEGWECDTEECHTTCGDGILTGAEVCDDWNTEDGDGCSADCMTIEEGYTCIEDMGASYCVTEGCGDQKIEEGEQCDEGTNSNDPDYTSYGWDEANDKPYCFMCKHSNFCGDGKVTGDEQCDEGVLDEDGNPTLRDEETNLPIGGDGTYGHCKPDCTWGERCGDGVLQDGEACDKGEGNDGSYGGCTSECKLAPFCGDGVVQENEVCDDGIAENTGLYGHCKADCSAVAGYCGDGEKNGQELCDNGANNGTVTYDGCTTECKFTSICGDGTVDEGNGEQCDEGMLDDNGRPTLIDGAGVPIGGYGNYGGCTAGCVKAPYCGDGVRNDKEKCDDGNTVAGDGCEANCMAITPKWECKEDSSGKSTCSVIPCGDGKVTGNEQCDDALNPTECFHCKARAGYMCLTGSPSCPVCSASVTTACCSPTNYCRPISDLYGDGIVDPNFEKCDDGNTKDGDGCSQGKIDAGYICPTPGKRCVARTCGDGIKAYGEECDDGNIANGDGCSARCKREEGYRCDTPGAPCVHGTCGDGIVQFGEECDSKGGIGCDGNCKLVNGYECPKDGGTCQAVTCGNGNAVPSPGYVSSKECDDGNKTNGDGCSSTCKIETGYHCDTVSNTSVCAKGTCGDNKLDGGEQCDDGNLTVNDGCSPWCEREFMFESYTDDDGVITYSPKCGDGITLWMVGEGGCDPKTNPSCQPLEQCDDGNLVSGDGCSSQCRIEPGFTCTDFSGDALSKTIDLDITYYDFRIPGQTTTNAEPASWTSANELTGGFMTSSLYNSIKALDSACGNTFSSTISGTTRKGYPDFGCTYGGSGCGGMVEDVLDADGKPVLVSNWASKKCTLRNPTTNISSHVTCKGTHHYWYRYVPGVNLKIESKLTMTQDATDLDKYSYSSGSFYPLTNMGYNSTSATPRAANGGEFTSELHTYFQYKGGEKLSFTGDDDVWAFINRRLFVDLGGMQSGTSDSGTLSNAACAAIGGVKCDAKYHIAENGIYELHFFQAERCSSGSRYQLTLDGFLKTGQSTCQSKCGDGIVAGNEQCDEVSETCINCKRVGCGDGVEDAGEICDSALNDKYMPAKHCLNTCEWSVCGDGIVDTVMGEECEPSSDPSCTDTCKYPRCGDGVVNGSEECDEGENNKDADYGGCSASCTLNAYCGDGEMNGTEKCDYGAANDDSIYNGCRTDCTLGPRCGDGVTNGYEECDDGTNNGDYGTCKPDCTLAPYCGDGIVNGTEACDKGASNMDDVYNGCSLACTLNGYCGDGIVNGPEACDDGVNDGSYGGCAKNCLTKGPYCGDGKVNGTETCDDGVNDGSYGGCNADCTKAAYCGDGIVNGSEACDPGISSGCTSACTPEIN